MRSRFALCGALWAALALAGPAAAHPWEGAQALVKAVEADIKTSGINGIRTHVPALEAALAEGQKAPAGGVVEGDTVYVLADAGAPALAAMLTAAAGDKTGAPKNARAIITPYPAVAFYLGTYYDEIGRFDDGLKTLDVGLNLESWNGVIFGEWRPILVAERGAALTGLKRWPEVLANYEDGLKLDDLSDHFKAVMHRGRGFALVELDKLDDGEAAYKESLKFEPGNARAMSELQYIARVRAGGPRTATQLGLTGKP
jgi:tetratricopeptide (TPR) repeat protein